MEVQEGADERKSHRLWKKTQSECSLAQTSDKQRPISLNQTGVGALRLCRCEHNNWATDQNKRSGAGVGLNDLQCVYGYKEINVMSIRMRGACPPMLFAKPSFC